MGANDGRFYDLDVFAMPEHVRVGLELKLGGNTSPLNHLRKVGAGDCVANRKPRRSRRVTHNGPPDGLRTPRPMSRDWPEYKKARDLAGSVFPVSETVILQTARKLGIGRRLGRATISAPKTANASIRNSPHHAA
jgi:hypothetical protein